ncbi:MAG: DUF4388 domain-containing protein [Acidothermaceae bacterium]
MKLEGSLDAFSLPDIFQLLSFTKKSGGLHLRRPATHGCVYFRDGAVTGATSDDGRQGLARRLVGSAAVGDDALTAAVDRAAAGDIGVARALLEAGAVDGDMLRAMVSEQAVDAVFDFLRWAEGDFSFSLDEPGPDDVGVSFGVEELVTDARSRLESWERACQVIPAPDVILTLPISVCEDPQVSRGEWALLALVDGRRTVADLVTLAGRGDFAVVSVLATLVQRELLSIRSGDADEGALALARRHALLARLESVPSAPVEPLAEPVSPQRSEFAPAPAAPTSSEQKFVPGEPEVADLPADESLFAGVTNAEVSSTSTVASVLAAAANGAGDGSVFSRSSTPPARPADLRGDDGASPRLVADTRAPVIPPRPEPFMPRRRPDFPEDAPRAAVGMNSVHGSAAVAADPVRSTQPMEGTDARAHIERDPSVNKSLLLRLIAGVRGL